MNRLCAIRGLRALAVFAALFTASGAQATCTAPIGNAGQIVYNTDYHVPQYCNGTQWEAFSALDPLAGGSGCLAPTASEGRLLYNGDYHVLQYCNGTAWVQVGSRGVNGSCTAPAGAEGQLVYNGDYHVLQYCNGAAWIEIGGGCTPRADPGTWTARPATELNKWYGITYAMACSSPCRATARTG